MENIDHMPPPNADNDADDDSHVFEKPARPKPTLDAIDEDAELPAKDNWDMSGLEQPPDLVTAERAYQDAQADVEIIPTPSDVDEHCALSVPLLAVPPSSRKSSARIREDSKPDPLELSLAAVADHLEDFVASSDPGLRRWSYSESLSAEEYSEREQSFAGEGDDLSDGAQLDVQEESGAEGVPGQAIFKLLYKHVPPISEIPVDEDFGQTGIPAILRYIPETRQAVHDVPAPDSPAKRLGMLWDSKKKCYILPNVQPPCGMVCDFCGKEQYAPSQLVTRGPVASSSSLSSPSDEDLSRMKEEGDYCCLQYFHLCKVLLLNWTNEVAAASSSVPELIDIGPSGHYGSKEARKAAKIRALEQLHMRDLHRRRAVAPAYYDGTARKSKVISFSMSEQSACLSKGWVLAPDPLAILNGPESLQFARKFATDVSEGDAESFRKIVPRAEPKLLILNELKYGPAVGKQKKRVLTEHAELHGDDFSAVSLLSALSSSYGSGGLLSDTAISPPVSHRSTDASSHRASATGPVHQHSGYAPKKGMNVPRAHNRPKSLFVSKAPKVAAQLQVDGFSSPESGIYSDSQTIPVLPSIPPNATPLSTRQEESTRQRRHTTTVSPAISSLSLLGSPRHQGLSSKGEGGQDGIVPLSLPPVPRNRQEAAAAVAACPPALLTQIFERTLSRKYANAAVRYYSNGNIFHAKLPDGSATCYYPDGSVAVCTSGVGVTQFITFAYEANCGKHHRRPRLMAVLDPAQSHGCCYSKTGSIRLTMDSHGGATYDPDTGSFQRRWSWHFPVHLSHENHAPPFQPVCLLLTNHLSLRCVRHDNITLTFTFGHLTARFPVSFSYLQPSRHEKGSTEQDLLYKGLEKDVKKTKLQIMSILSSMTSLISSRRLYDRAQAVGNASPAVHTLSKKPHRTDLEKPPADSHSQMESVKSTEGSALPSLSTKHSRTLLKADRTSPKKELVKLPAAPTPLASVKKLGRKLSKRKQKPERCQ